MKQSSLPINKTRPLTERNVIHVAFGKFNPKCRPANIEIAMADPVFYGILKARARQMVRLAEKNKEQSNG
ncbi:MAG: hypothetical protein COA86_02700 [Kangiella sp.]|nr:MAG: hypothetical protein COA86_02700 [Kangiella sp.]